MQAVNRFYRPTFNVGHRGVRTDSDPMRMAPENTIPAFQEAAKQGAGIELDVMPTADNKLAIHHDEMTGRIFKLPGKQKLVEQCTWAELQTAKLNEAEHEADIFKLTGQPYKTPEAFRDVKMSQLSEVLDAVPDTHVSVELKPTKTSKPRFETDVVDTIHEKEATNRVTLISFKPNSLRRVKKADPNIKTGFNFTIPELLKNNKPFLWSYINLYAKRWVKADGLQPDYNSTTPALIKIGHAAGMPVVPWVYHQTRAEEKAQFPSLLGMGVDGLITNAVDLLKQALKNRGSQPSSLDSLGKE